MLNNLFRTRPDHRQANAERAAEQLPGPTSGAVKRDRWTVQNKLRKSPPQPAQPQPPSNAGGQNLFRRRPDQRQVDPAPAPQQPAAAAAGAAKPGRWTVQNKLHKNPPSYIQRQAATPVGGEQFVTDTGAAPHQPEPTPAAVTAPAAGAAKPGRWTVQNRLRKAPPPQTRAQQLHNMAKPIPWYTRQAVHDDFAEHLVHERPISAQEDAALKRQFSFVATGQDQACCLVNGKLLHWEAGEQSWKLAKEVGPVKALHFGANRQMNVLTAEGVLHALDASGKPSASFAALKLPADLVDLAVSPTGSVAFISASKPHLIGFLDAEQRRSGGQQVVWGQGPVCQRDPGVASMAYQNDGSLLILDKSGQLSEGRRAPPASAGTQTIATQEVLWSAPMDQSAKAGPIRVRLSKLQVLPDGSIGALDHDHVALARGKDGKWLPAPSNTPNAAQQFYGNFQRIARGEWNVAGLSTPVGFGEQNWRQDRPWWKPGMLHRSHEGERLHSRHANWLGAHQPFQLTKGAWGQVKQQLHQAIASDRATLGDPATLAPLAPQHPLRADPALLSTIERNTTDILKALSVRLGIWDEHGREIPGFQKDPAYKQVHAAPRQVQSPANVLYQLHATRTRLFGADDAHARRLAQLLEKNVFLGFDSDRHVSLPAGTIVMPSAVDPSAIAGRAVDAGDVEKMWRDHGMLSQAVAQASQAKPAQRGAADTLSNQIRERVNANTAAALARWEALPDAAQPSDVDSADHPLAALLATRTAQFGVNDPLLQRLRKVAQSKDIHFEVELAHEGSGMNLPHLLKNKFAVYTGKMLHDHAILAELSREPAPAPAHIAARAAELEQVAVTPAATAPGEQPGQPALNQITQLYRSGFVNLDRVDRFLEAYDYLNGGITNPKHKLGRALNAQGELREPLVGAYQNMVRSMKPGESITLNSSTGGGLDAEGVSQVMKLKPIPLITGLITAQALQIEPINQVAANRSYGLNIEKNADGGINIAINKSTNVTALPVAAKISQGIAITGSKTVPGATLLAAAGMSTKIRLGLTERTENVAMFTIAPDDFGKVDKVLAGLLGGTLSPFDLMNLSDGGANLRQASTTLAANLDFTPNLATGIISTLAEEPYRNQAKVLGVVVGQLNLEAKHTSGHENMEKSDGSRENKIISKTEYAIGVTGVAALEAQVGNSRDLPDGTKHGFENQNKAPIAIAVATKQLYGSSLVSEGYIQHYDADGRLSEINTILAAKNTSDSDNAIRAMRDNYTNPNRQFVGKHLPQLQELMDSNPEVKAPLEKMIASRLPMEVTMQLKPHILDQVRHYKGVAGTPTKAEIQQFIAEKMAQPRNLRIINIGALDANTYKTGWSAGFLALRYQSGAENTFRSPWANIHVNYPASDASEAQPTLDLSEHALPRGKKHHPDAAQIERVLRDGGPELLDFLSNPVGADTARQHYAGAVADVMRQLRKGAIADLSHVNPEQEAALAAFFPPEENGSKQKMAAILNDNDRLTLFLNGLQPEGLARSASVTGQSAAPVKGGANTAASASHLQRLLRPTLEPLKQQAAALRATVHNRALGEPAKRAARAELAKVEQQLEQELGTNALTRAIKKLGGADVRPKAVYADTARYSVADLQTLRDKRQLAPAIRLAAAAELAQRAARAAIPAGIVSPAATEAGALLEAQEVLALQDTVDQLDNLTVGGERDASGLSSYANLLLLEAHRGGGSADLRLDQAWLKQHDVTAAPNPGSGNMRLVHALLQHASSDYRHSHETMARAIQQELLAAGHDGFGSTVNGGLDPAAYQAAMGAVGRRFPDAQFDARLLSPHEAPRRLSGADDGSRRQAVLIFKGEQGWSALHKGEPRQEIDVSLPTPVQEAALRSLDQALARARDEAPPRRVFEPRVPAGLPGMDAVVEKVRAQALELDAIFEPRPPARKAGLDSALQEGRARSNTAAPAHAPAHIMQPDGAPATRIKARADDAVVWRQATAMIDGWKRVEQSYHAQHQHRVFRNMFSGKSERVQLETQYRTITSPAARQAGAQLQQAIASLTAHASAQQAHLQNIERLAFQLHREAAPAGRALLSKQQDEIKQEMLRAKQTESDLRAVLRAAMARMEPFKSPS
ncbi:MAG: hypothetical protein V4754_00935 [Pseudomonadota bacterium]